MNKLLCPESLEQSVLGALPAIRTNEMDRPKRPALASQLYHKQLCFQSAAWPMSDPDIVHHTDINDDINTDLLESPAPMMKSPTVHRWSCFGSSAWPTLNSEIIKQTDVNFDMETDLPENSAPMKSSDLMLVDWEDAVRRRVLRGRSMESGSSCEIHNQLIFLDLVRSEGLRRWSMALHEEYHHELFNRLPGYCGGDLHNTEDIDGFNPDVREIIDFTYYTHSRPVGGETRGVEMIDMVYMCRTVSGNEHETRDEPDRRLETDDDLDTDSVAELEYNTWNDACAWEFRSVSGNDLPGLIQNPPTDVIQNIRRNLEMGDMLMVAYNLLGSVWGNSTVCGTVGYGTMTRYLSTGCILTDKLLSY